MVGLTHAGATYEIRVQGHLDSRWSGWFDDLVMSHEPAGATRLTGPVADQAALYGLLERLRDLGLELLSVDRVQDRDPRDPQELDGRPA